MTRNRSSMRTVTDLYAPMVPFVDVGAATRLTTDLMAQASRLWVDLWFTNLNRATAVFWDDVRAQRRSA
ncbi:MAG TPA: hypothetical protein VK875_03575 [Euzebyales bacterium]|nr:hypothetical protein [Euzebyales bacterium]